MKTDEEIIAELSRNNVPAFCFLKLEAKQLLLKEQPQGNVQALCECGCSSQWLRADEGLSPNKVYRLKPGYEPKPEYEEPQEIITDDNGWLLVKVPACGYKRTICDAEIHKTFSYWQAEDGSEIESLREVRKQYHEGHKVVAIFRKD